MAGAKGKKCMRRGPLTRNGFLNFMREFRAINCGLNMIQAVKEGAKCWKNVSCKNKEKFRLMGGKKRSKSCPKKCPRKPRKASCPKKKCSKPGPVTANGYLNFIRDFRKKNCGLKPNDLVRKAAKAWCALSACEKRRYREMACKKSKKSNKSCGKK